jgi:hypothetical protein
VERLWTLLQVIVTQKRRDVEEEVEEVPSPESLLIANGALGDISGLAFELELYITFGTVARTGMPAGMGMQELRPLRKTDFLTTPNGFLPLCLIAFP